MKQIIFSLFISAFLIFIGCSDNGNSIVDPVELQTALNKNNVSAFDIGDLGADGHQVSVSQLIDGSNGGVIQISKTYWNGTNDITVIAKIKFRPNSFDGEPQNITATTNDEDASITFSPALKFNKIVKLNLTFVGLDLKSMGLNKKNKVDFYYISDDGSRELIKNHGISINEKDGEISVKNAELHHFSRYAFAQ